MSASPGALLFARYASPPNSLGYCGPEDHRALVEYAAAGLVDGGLRDLARGFEGAWPYLRLIAEAAGIPDPLDGRVVEAYWVGSPLLERVDPSRLCAFVEERFRPFAGPRTARLTAAVLRGAVPHHNFHVFCVSPWVGLLREGRVEEPLEVLDRCRIRWGTVLTVEGGIAVVRSRALDWDGAALRPGRLRTERAAVAVDGLTPAPVPAPGDVVALHWDRVCDRLGRRGLEALRRHTRRAAAAAVPPAA